MMTTTTTTTTTTTMAMMMMMMMKTARDSADGCGAQRLGAGRVRVARLRQRGRQAPELPRSPRPHPHRQQHTAVQPDRIQPS
eukprot:3569661-Rhodomonas_salina.2